MFDDLKSIFKEKKNENKNENESENESQNERVSENENESVSENENENENESDDGQCYKLKQINNNFKKIDKTKSFEDQINIFKKVANLNDYWHIEYYEDNKETNVRLFKLKLVHILNDVDDNLFKEVFGFTSVKLADILINTTKKEDNKMIIDHIEIKKDKIFEQDEYSQYVIQPAYKRDDLLDTVKVIKQLNETLQLYLT